MSNLAFDDPLAVAVVMAIRGGDVEALKVLLGDNPSLVTSQIVAANGGSRSLLHIAADWPGHFPHVAETIAILIAAGANPDPPVTGKPDETSLHWAASSDDVDAIEALLDGGAEIEAPGEHFTGGAPMACAVIYAQWKAARALLERGARTTLWQSAALGLMERVEEFFAAQPSPMAEEVTNALWHACRGGQLQIAEYLIARGGDLNWIGYDSRTPLQAAMDNRGADIVPRLRSMGAKTADELA